MNFLSITITLFLILDPFGNIPLCLSILSRVDEKRRKQIILREMFIALIILLFFLLFGGYILTWMNITQPALTIAGGVVLFLIANKMIFPSKLVDDELNPEPLIVPIAVPLVAGPSSITMVMLLSNQFDGNLSMCLLSLLIAWIASSLIVYFSDFFHKILGIQVVKAMERMMGLILTTIAVQMLLTGLVQVFK